MNRMSREERKEMEDLVLRELWEFGISKTAAKELAPIEGIVSLLSQETLPPNPNERPELPTSKKPLHTHETRVCIRL